MLRCELLEHGLSFELDVLYDCCMTHHENLGRPIIKKPYHGEIFDWDKLFEINDKSVFAATVLASATSAFFLF